MFCGEITTNRRQFYCFRCRLEHVVENNRTSQTRRLRVKLAKTWQQKSNSFRNIISYNSANAAETSGPEMSVTDILKNVYIDRINNVNVKKLR